MISVLISEKVSATTVGCFSYSLTYSQFSILQKISLAALVNQADGELFEMYNGFTEAYAHNLANRR